MSYLFYDSDHLSTASQPVISPSFFRLLLRAMLSAYHFLLLFSGHSHIIFTSYLSLPATSLVVAPKHPFRLLFFVASRLNFLLKQLLYCITEYSQPKNDLPLSNVHFFNDEIIYFKKTGILILNEFEKFDERNFFRFTWISACGFLDLGLTVTFPPRTVSSLKEDD